MAIGGLVPHYICRYSIHALRAGFRRRLRLNWASEVTAASEGSCAGLIRRNIFACVQALRSNMQ